VLRRHAHTRPGRPPCAPLRQKVAADGSEAGAARCLDLPVRQPGCAPRSGVTPGYPWRSGPWSAMQSNKGSAGEGCCMAAKTLVDTLLGAPLAYVPLRHRGGGTRRIRGTERSVVQPGRRAEQSGGV